MVTTKSQNGTTTETIQFEVLKPMPVRKGIQAPFLSLTKDGKMTFNHTARLLFGWKEGGIFEVVMDKGKRDLYIVPRDEETPSTYTTNQSGKFTDMLLPERLRVKYDLKKDKCERVYINLTPIRYDFDKAYRLEKR